MDVSPNLTAMTGSYINLPLFPINRLTPFPPNNLRGMDEPTALRCRNAALETELRLVKEQLTQAQNGGAYLVNLVGRQVGQAAHASQQEEITILRSQLEDALQCNAQLERLLAASRRARAAVQRRERNLDKDLRALKGRVGDQADVFGDLGSGQEDIGKSSVRKDSAARVKGEELKEGVNWICKTGAKEDQESSLLSDEDELDFNGSVFQSAVFVRGKREEADADLKNHPKDAVLLDDDDEMPMGKTIYHGPNEGGPDARLEAETKNFDLQPGGTLIQGSNGETFQVSTPSLGPLRKWQGLNGVRIRPGLSAIDPTCRPFTSNQHNRLAGATCWVEELNETEYRDYWPGYARQHSGHTAAEWQAYYEAEVRPLWLEKLARAELEKAPSPDERRDSKVAKSVEEDANVLGGAPPSSTSQESLVEVAAAVGEELREEESLIDLGADWKDDNDMPAREGVSQLEDGADSDRDPEEVFHELEDANGLSNGSISLSSSILTSIETDQANGAVTTVAKSRCQEDNGEYIHQERQLSEAVELRTARPVHIRSYSKEEVTQRDIPSRGSSGNLSAPTESLSAQAQRSIPAQMKTSLEQSMHAFDRFNDARWQGMVSYSGNSPSPELRRTVCISNIAVGTTLIEVLDRVSGGRIIYSKYIDTAKMKTTPPMQGNTVLVEFFGSHNAQRYRDLCSKTPISFPLADGTQQKAVVSLIATPTRPIPGFIIGAIHDSGHSRVVYVHDSRGEVTADFVVAKCCIGRQVPGRAWEIVKLPIRQSEEQGLVSLEFAGVEDARRAYFSLCYCLEFSGMQKGFLPDPCMRQREVGEVEVELKASE